MGKKLTTHVHVVTEDLQSVVLKPGDTVPSWAKDQVTNPKVYAPEDGTTVDGAEVEPETDGEDSELFDPSADGTGIDEVNNYLANADDDEVQRVLAAEAAGKNRKGIVNGPYAPEAS